MQRITNSFLQAVLSVIVFFHCDAQDTSRQTIVASYADKYTVSLAEITDYVRGNYYLIRYPKNVTKAYTHALEDKTVRQLKMIDFFTLGLNEKAALLPNMRRSINEELVIRYYNTQYERRSVDEDSIKNAYKEMGKEVVYRQIVLKTGKDASQKDQDALISLVNSIQTKLHHGADFATLARQYSQENGSTHPGGLMPPLNRQKCLSNDVFSTIFHLAVNQVRIIETTESFLIVKVVKIKKLKILPYDKVKEDIRNTLADKYRHYGYDWYELERQRLIEEKTIEWNASALQKLAQWSNIPNFYQTSYSDTLRYAISHGNNFIILNHSRGKVDLKEYLRLLDEILTWGKFVSVNEEDIKKYILDAERTDLIVRKAYKLHLENNVLNPQTTNLVLRSGILMLYDQQEIEDRIPVPGEKELKEFYEANKDSMYYQLAKVNIAAIIDTNRSFIEHAKQKLTQNVPFDNLAPVVSLKAFMRGRDGVWKTFYGGGEPPYLSKAASQLQVNETAGPIVYDDTTLTKQHALIKCIATREEKQLTYDKAKKTLMDDFKEYHRNKIHQSVAEQLKKKYHVIVYDDVLKKNLMECAVNAQ